MAITVVFPKPGTELERHKQASREARTRNEARERRAKMRQDAISAIAIAGSLLLGILVAKVRHR